MKNIEDFMGIPAETHELPPKQFTIRPINATNLNDLNLEAELFDQYRTARMLYDIASQDEDVMMNAKVQALNSISSIIAQITKTRTELFNAERMKTLENTLIATLKEFPEIKATFLVKYKEALENA